MISSAPFRIFPKNIIPPITHPMGKHLDQPDPKQILIDDTHAIMSQKVFDRLGEYSCSYPTGAYPGKIWKAHPSSFNRKLPDEWYLRWYGDHHDETKVSIHQRIILIT